MGWGKLGKGVWVEEKKVGVTEKEAGWELGKSAWDREKVARSYTEGAEKGVGIRGKGEGWGKWVGVGEKDASWRKGGKELHRGTRKGG